MSPVRIKEKRIVTALHAECWNMSLLGNPKMRVICGECTSPFKTREYFPLVNMKRELIAHCPHCKKWNRTGLFRS